VDENDDHTLELGGIPFHPNPNYMGPWVNTHSQGLAPLPALTAELLSFPDVVGEHVL
jgi:hypothetical protein